MTKRMLIDATQAEETRVAIVCGNRLEEYDYESAIRKQLKGSIFLAKVTRVEPSLQAAFVDYGGNRHGFLPFSEIHPDYYRIPIADREELLAEAAEQISEEVDEEDLEDEDETAEDETVSDETDEDEDGELDEDEDEDEDGEEAAEDESAEDEDDEEEQKGRRRGRRGGRRNGNGRGRGRGRRGRKNVDEVGGSEDEDETPRAPRLKHQYKIQEVIKRRQIMLIQVNKEERGNKGAAVTTYISLPGRYCVLMPNSPRGGGVSRKISNSKDRARMKEILAELNIPQGMSVIMRTAGVERSKAEIKRDLDYLMRLWDTIRDETLKATAPALINEESNLCKRAIRDLYTRDIDEVLVAGDEGYKTAKSFMKMLMPSHAKRVQPYKDEAIPLYMRYQVESQIDEIHKPTAQLRSGGYIVINPTEALVSIDVNSGRSTKERHIEGTALKTNLEAAEEVARQLRLRDLGGLVVIDFIDMEVNKNNTAVERKLKEAMSTDRARVQIGRISPFGLLELSRQRLNPSLVEAHFEVCPHCEGIGVVRTVESAALAVLRAIEEEGIRGRSAEVKVEVSTEVALYLLNQKRKVIQNIEQRHGLEVFIHANDTISSSDFEMDIVKGTGESESKSEPKSETTSEPRQAVEGDENGEEEKSGRRRRRRGGRNRNRNRNREDYEENAEGEEEEEAAAANGGAHAESDDEEGNGDERKKRRRRRGRRGGRRRRGAQAEREGEISEEAEGATVEAADEKAAEAEAKPEEQAEEKPKKTRSRGKKADEAEAEAKPEEQAEEKPKKTRSRRKKADEAEAEGEEKAEEKPKKATRSRAKKAEEKPEEAAADEQAEEKPKKATRSRAKKADEGAEEKAEEKPKKATRSRAKKAEPKEETAAKPAVVDFPEKAEQPTDSDAEENKEPEKKRKGWWNRLVD